PVVSEEMVICEDGRVVIQTFVDRKADVTPARTLDGKPLASFDLDTKRMAGALLRNAADFDNSPHPYNWNSRFVHLTEYDKYGGTKTTDWYFVHDGYAQGHGYFAKVHGPQPGYLGRTGFRPDKPPLDDQFTIRTDDSSLLASGSIQSEGRYVTFQRMYNDKLKDTLRPFVYDLATDDGLVQVDLKNRSVRLLRHGKPVSACIEMRGLGDGPSHSVRPGIFVLWRTNDRVRVLDFDGKQKDEYRLPKELRTRDFWWYRLPNDVVLAIVTKNSTRHLYWFEKDGRIVRSEKVALKKENRAVSTFDIACTIPSPGLILASGFLEYVSRSSTNWSALQQAFARYWPALLAVEALSLILAVGCFCRQRKFGLSGAWIWVGFMLLFGVPAYLGYRLSRVWPAQLACPHCKQPTPRDRPACIHCGQNFPPPVRKGIEVFA
ncbi:MAG: hypothetical protein ABFC77_14905, partial [Thermoguttaceae bacterium]